jgi:hypothetical protein
MSTNTASSPIVKLATVGIVAIGFYYLSLGMGKGAQFINELPVEGTAFSAADSTVAKSPVTAVAPSAIHPLLVESSKKASYLGATATEEAPAEMVSLDKLFGRTTKAEVAKSYDFKSMKGLARLQSTMSNGAIVNNEFYSRGDKVTSFGYLQDETGAPKYPTLLSIKPDRVVIGDPLSKDNRVTLKLER